MKSILFLERTELAPSIQQYLQLPFVQMLHSEELFKKQLFHDGSLVVVHRKILDEKAIQNLNRFFMMEHGARLILFYDVLLVQTPSLFPAFPVSVLFEKRRDSRTPVQIQAQWSNPSLKQSVEIQNLSRLGALVVTTSALPEKLGLISFVPPLVVPGGAGNPKEKARERGLKYWSKVRWFCNLSQKKVEPNFLYGLYFVAQDS